MAESRVLLEGPFKVDLKDMKGSVDPATLDAETFVAHGHRCGYTLGLAHSRAGDPDVSLGYIGTGAALADAMWESAEAYADQTEYDYGRFIEAIHEGRLKSAELEPATPAAATPAPPAKAGKKKAAKAKASGGVKR